VNLKNILEYIYEIFWILSLGLAFLGVFLEALNLVEDNFAEVLEGR